MKRAFLAALTAFALASCVSPRAGAPGSTDASQIEFGDWRRASQRSIAARFSANIARRYAQGAAVPEVTADLRANQFACAPGQRTSRGAAPVQICRRTVRDRSCVHTWQVHLFGTRQTLTQTRALYDRSCGDDGLLGGPT